MSSHHYCALATRDNSNCDSCMRYCWNDSDLRCCVIVATTARDATRPLQSLRATIVAIAIATVDSVVSSLSLAAAVVEVVATGVLVALVHIVT